MTTSEKIDEYLDRVLTYLNTPWDQRDPAEYEAILSEKAEVVAECKRNPEVERQPVRTDTEQPMKINLNAGKKCRFIQPHPLTMKLTVGLFKTGCPCCGKELWTVEELPGCLIAASRLLILEEDPEVDPLRAVIRFNWDHD